MSPTFSRSFQDLIKKILFFPFPEKALEIIAVGAVSHGLGYFLEFLFGDVPHAKGDLLETGDLEALTLLDDLDEVGCLDKGFVSSRVQPGNATAR